MDLTRLKDHTQIAASVATVIAAVIAIVGIGLSVWNFQRQTFIQADQAAHGVVQEHMQLRVDHPDIVTIQRRLYRDPHGFAELDRTDRNLYVTVSEHGIAMAEYVFKLTEGDPGWEDTVQGWIIAYEPFLRRVRIDCGDYDPDFDWFIENRALNIDHRYFCEEQVWGSIGLLPLGIAAAILAVGAGVLASRRERTFRPHFRRIL